jgi:hypothetical protein
MNDNIATVVLIQWPSDTQELQINGADVPCRFDAGSKCEATFREVMNSYNNTHQLISSTAGSTGSKCSFRYVFRKL